MLAAGLTLLFKVRLWAESAGLVWAAKLDMPKNDVRALYRSGALLVSRSFAVALNCLLWFGSAGAMET